MSEKMDNKAIIIAMKERGGWVETKFIPDVKTAALRGVVLEHIEKGSIVSTDELSAYNLRKGDGYIHGAVEHSRKEWAWTDRVTGVRHSTNSAERSGTCLRRPLPGRIFTSANCTLTATSASSLSARISGRCGTRCSIF